MKKILFTLTAIAISTYIAYAQEEISSTVEVKREFEGKLLEISKSKLDTQYSDTLTKLNLNFDYSIFDRPIKDLYEFSPMQSAHLKREGLVRYPVLYAKMAMSYPWMPDADIFVQPHFGDRFSMLVYGKHHSFWGHDKNNTTVISPVNRMVNEGGLSLAYTWTRGELSADGFYSHNLYYFDPLLSSSSEEMSRTFQNGGANLRVRSTNPDPTAFYYDAKVKYLNTSDIISYTSLATSENRLDVDAVLGLTVRQKHKILLGFKTSDAFVAASNASYYSGNIEFTPHYKFDYGKWRFKAGLTMAGRYSNDEEMLDPSTTGIAHLYPDVSVSFEAAPHSLWIYAKADGENKLNSLSSHLSNNPWMATSSFIAGNYSIPIRAELGLNGVVRDLFSYSVSGVYTHYNEYLSYLDLFPMQFCYTFKDVDVMAVKAEVLFKSKSFSGGANGHYSYFFDQDNIPYMVPAFKVNAFGKYNYRERLFFEVSLNYYSKMRGNTDIPGFVDLGAKFTFAANSKLSFFLQGQNLINQKIMYVQNYLEPGINFGLGLYLKL